MCVSVSVRVCVPVCMYMDFFVPMYVGMYVVWFVGHSFAARIKWDQTTCITTILEKATCGQTKTKIHPALITS